MTDIAIIGISARLPMASTLEELHDNLCRGRDAVRELPRDRRRFAAITEPDPQVAGYLDRVDLFDHAFFKLSRRDAERMDPQQRILLELAVEVIENAGYRLEDLRGTNTAVLVGAGQSGYLDLQDSPDASAVSGNLLGPLAGRVSYLLDLHGPAMVIETSCSSALVAVHESCMKLASREIDHAIAGGITVFARVFRKDEGMGVLGVVSQDGRSKAFDASANGTGLGEGGGLVLLRRLDDALRDRDCIHAVIKGSAINQDGGRSNGLTAPSPAAQAEVIAAAWQRAGVAADSIGYVEAHGTGTRLGDPIEIQGMNQAFARHTGRTGFCAVSTIKSNLGHLGYAAGVAGLIKAVLSLRHQRLYPSLHMRTPNPLIEFGGAVYVNTELRDWPAGNTPRRAGVSSFGVSGTNAHVVVEEAPPRTGSVAERRAHLVTLSARSAPLLREYADRLVAYLERQGLALADVAYTLCRGRSHHPVRAAWVVGSMNELLAALRHTARSEPVATPERAIVMLASDHPEGHDRDSMARAAADSPVLARALTALEERGIDRPGVLAFAHQHAVHAMLGALGVTPTKLIGAGVGNAVLAHALGRVTLDEAVQRAAQAVAQPRELNRDGLARVMAELRDQGEPLFIELGAPGSLSAAVRELHPGAVIIPTSDRGALRSHLDIVADVYQHGGVIDWDAHYAGTRLLRVELPAVPFERTRCWFSEPLAEGWRPARARAEAAPEAPASMPAPGRTVATDPDATATERCLAALWGRVLKVDRVPGDVDYQELGGDSLNGVELVELIDSELGVELDVLDLFDHSTLREMAAYIDGLGGGAPAKAAEAAAATQAARVRAPVPAAPAPLSAGQSQLLYLYKLDPTSAFYNMPAAFRMTGALDAHALRRAFEDVVTRHAVLRTVYSDGEPLQIVLPPARFDLPVVDLAALPAAERDERLRALLGDDGARPFDLGRDSMLRASLYRLGEREHVLCMTLHHIAADGWSFGIILRELTALYRAHATGAAPELPRLGAQYTDYARWQRSYLHSPAAADALRYFTALLRPLPPNLALPRTADARPADRFQGVRRSFTVPPAWRDGVERLSRDQGASLFMTLLAGYAALLHRYAGQSDMIIGTPVANRPEAYRDLVGLFSNTLPLRIDLSGDPRFRDLVQRVKELCRGAFAHQAAPFERIVAAVQPERTSERSPLIQAVFALQNAPADVSALPGVEVTPVELGGATSRFDLGLSMRASGDGMVGVVEYRDDLFDAGTIERLLTHYRRLLESAVSDPGTPLSRLRYLTDDEERALSETFGRATTVTDFDF